MKYDRLIWDFNGTVLDDVDICIRSANRLLQNHGLPVIPDREHYLKVFGFPVISYYERLGFDFSVVDYDTLAHEWVSYYLDEEPKAKLRTDILQTVTAVKVMGISQTLLSMTEHSMLIRQLSRLPVASLFDEVYGREDIYAQSKLALCSRWRGSHPDEKALFIGDTVHDAASAEEANADCVLLSGGHENDSTLKTHGVPVIHSPLAILDLIR